MRNHRHGSVVDGHTDVHGELESISGKVVVITGGARGIGLATGRLCTALGPRSPSATSMSQRSNRRART